MHTEKDGEIVAWVGRIGAADAEHVMERFAMERDARSSAETKRELSVLPDDCVSLRLSHKAVRENLGCARRDRRSGRSRPRSQHGRVAYERRVSRFSTPPLERLQ